MTRSFVLTSVLTIFVLCKSGMAADDDAAAGRANLFPSPEMQGVGSAAADWVNLVRGGRYEFRHLSKGGGQKILRFWDGRPAAY